jgi:SAM-dependent methyltransferase
LGERPLWVADIGAGTGILSRLLRRLGHQVIAIEPDELMRVRLTGVSPGIAALGGTAENIPLADRSVHAVVAGQAYHWFDGARAHAELARVLRPGGVFAAFGMTPIQAHPGRCGLTRSLTAPKRRLTDDHGRTSSGASAR